MRKRSTPFTVNLDQFDSNENIQNFIAKKLEGKKVTVLYDINNEKNYCVKMNIHQSNIFKHS